MFEIHWHIISGPILQWGVPEGRLGWAQKGVQKDTEEEKAEKRGKEKGGKEKRGQEEGGNEKERGSRSWM